MTPDEFTIKETFLDVGDGHQLYVQLWGNPAAAETVVFLHGGPGNGCSDSHKTLFDPATHKVIFFDQRGSGKSLPYGSLENNDTDHLIEDINTVTRACGVEEFSIVGGSWGSCLGLAYAIRFPAKVTRMVLRGIFTGRQVEADYLYTGQFKAFFPDVWKAFVDSVPVEFRNNPSDYHKPRVLGDDPEMVKKSAYAYAALEGSIVSLDDRVKPQNFDVFDPIPATIECHYTLGTCFMEDGYILNNANKLTMPIVLVQGRYDFVCPPSTAYELSQKLPNAKLYWTVAGHSGHDRANWELTRALIAAGNNSA